MPQSGWPSERSRQIAAHTAKLGVRLFWGQRSGMKLRSSLGKPERWVIPPSLPPSLPLYKSSFLLAWTRGQKNMCQSKPLPNYPFASSATSLSMSRRIPSQVNMLLEWHRRHQLTKLPKDGRFYEHFLFLLFGDYLSLATRTYLQRDSGLLARKSATRKVQPPSRPATSTSGSSIHATASSA